ncbi:MAG TPA: hypothetical protein VFQ34_13805 [Nitrospiraceae bacterium]|nr:hypothetical protein [Nitrospiraceae bacterium]
MARFKRYRPVVPHRAARALGLQARRRAVTSRRLAEEMTGHWILLRRHCQDHNSRLRLDRLKARIESRDVGVQESAIAELELAMLLLRTGARVEFLAESQARSADLECDMAGDRCFVEITAMVGAVERSLRLGGDAYSEADDEQGAGTPEAMFRDAILARIAQKAKQLADYCAPVVLAISVPRLDREVLRSRWSPSLDIDVRHLAGSISLLLLRMRHLSGVLLALWDVEPLPATSAVRLSNAAIVERPRQQAAYPRLRMFVQNPGARFRLTEAQQQAFRGLL